MPKSLVDLEYADCIPGKGVRDTTPSSKWAVQSMSLNCIW